MGGQIPLPTQIRLSEGFHILTTIDCNGPIDGMGLELIDPAGSVVAEIFRCDSSKTVIVTTFNNDIPLEIFDYYYQEALIRLDPFEDGSLFASAGISHE